MVKMSLLFFRLSRAIRTSGVAVLKMLQMEGKVGEELTRTILCWPGFSVHHRAQLGCDDADGQEALAQYILRKPFSLEKIHY